MVRRVVVALCITAYISIHASFLLYDISKSFEENISLPSSIDIKPVTLTYEKRQFLGYPVATPIGVAACAVMTSKGIEIASQLGFSIFTYKTVRSEAKPSYSLPNICFVDCTQQISIEDIHGVFNSIPSVSACSDSIALSNSFGNASLDLEWVKKDIARARSLLKENQLLIVSVFEEGLDLYVISQQFAKIAKIVEEVGAQAVELNLSCPNVLCDAYYKKSEYVDRIVKAVYKAISIPIIIKVGLFDTKEQMREIVRIAAYAGAKAIAGINSIPVFVRNQEGNPVFGENRKISGLSGDPIRSLAKQFIRDIRQIITQDGLALEIIGIGGVTRVEHIQEFLEAGASLVMSASGFMNNPYFLMS